MNENEKLDVAGYAQIARSIVNGGLTGVLLAMCFGSGTLLGLEGSIPGWIERGLPALTRPPLGGLVVLSGFVVGGAVGLLMHAAGLPIIARRSLWTVLLVALPVFLTGLVGSGGRLTLFMIPVVILEGIMAYYTVYQWAQREQGTNPDHGSP